MKLCGMRTCQDQGQCQHRHACAAETPRNAASDLKLVAGDDCPKCGGELVAGRHRFDQDGGLPDCDWLWCLDCDFQTDPE